MQNLALNLQLVLLFFYIRAELGTSLMVSVAVREQKRRVAQCEIKMKKGEQLKLPHKEKQVTSVFTTVASKTDEFYVCVYGRSRTYHVLNFSGLLHHQLLQAY